MPAAKKNAFPAILIAGFSSKACFSVASALAARGYPVVAACEPGDPASAEAARGAGAAVLEASKEDALRAGLERFGRETPDLPGLVFVGADRAYSVKDIVAVAEALAADPSKMAVADRARSVELGFAERLEARAAHWAFAAAHGRPVRDPWSGLIGLPASHVGDFLGEKGSGKSYLFRLLLTMQRHGIKAVNVPVDAPCGRWRDDTAKGRLLDIVKIALMPLLFISSSLTLTVADYCLSFLFFYLLLPGNKPVSIMVGHFTGAFIGYLLSRNIVFGGKGGSWRAEAAITAKYAVLFGCMYCASLLLVSVMVDDFHIEFAVAQIISGILLYAPNYLIQRDFVFGRRQAREA
jgi:putative flippase GtrA